ncbi:MAG: TolC family protein [Bacteroidota bacterium]
MTKHCLLTALAIWWLGTGFAQSLPDTVSLQGLLQYTQSQTLSELEADIRLQQARSRFDNFVASRRPQVNGYADLPNFIRSFSETTQPNGSITFNPISYNNSSVGLSVEQAITVTGGTVFLQSDLQRFDDFQSNGRLYNGIPARLGIVQPLFAFNPWKWDKQIEPLRLEESKSVYVQNKQIAKQEIGRFFLALLLAHNEYQIAASNRQNSRELLKIAQERYDLGKISRRDLLQLQLESTTAERNVLSAGQVWEQASADLQVLFGIPLPKDRLVPELPLVLPSLELDPTTVGKMAAQQNPSLITSERQLLEADREVARAKRENGFQMDLFASVGLAGSSMQLQEVYTQAMDEEVVRLQVNIPILDWGQRRNSTQIAQAQSTFLQRKLQQDRLLIEIQAEQTARQFNRLETEMELAGEIKDLAEEQYSISKNSYLLGAISLSELTLSQTAKDAAVRQYMQSLRSYWSTYLDLQTQTLYDFAKQTNIQD